MMNPLRMLVLDIFIVENKFRGLEKWK